MCRLFSDTGGNFTCITHNGTSVVDYMLASTNLFDMFTDFGVDDKDDSIHFPLYCQIKLTCNRILDERPQYQETTEIWNTFKWRPELQELFIKNFHRNFEAFKNETNISVQESILPLLPDFSNVVRSSAEKMKCSHRLSRPSVERHLGGIKIAFLQSVQSIGH